MPLYIQPVNLLPLNNTWTGTNAFTAGVAAGYQTVTVKNSNATGRAEFALGTTDSDFAGFVAMAGPSTANEARQFDIGSSVSGRIGIWANNSQWFTMEAGGNIGLGTGISGGGATTIATNALTFDSTTGTSGIAMYNTSDQVTNYEKVVAFWNSNVYTIAVTQAGTGTQRNLGFTAGTNTNVVIRNATDLIGHFALNPTFSGTTSGAQLGVAGTWTNSQNTGYAISLVPTTNQTSTAAWTMYFASPFDSGSGSGAKNLIDVGTNTAGNGTGTHTSKFKVDSTGNVTATNAILTSAGGVGYTTGAGSTVTQATSKSTGVTINAYCGTITMNGASLGAGTIVSFTVSNNKIGANDVVFIQHDSVGTLGGYTADASSAVAATSFVINVRNNTASPLSEAIVLRYVIIKATTS